MGYDVQITESPRAALFDLKGDAAALTAWAGSHLPPLPARPNSLTKAAGQTLCWIGPDHWILRAGLTEEAAILAVLRPDAAPADVSVVLISDTLVFFALTGPDADQVMAVATPLDAARLAADGITLTEALGTKAMIRRIPGGYEIGVDVSYATFVEDYLDRIRA